MMRSRQVLFGVLTAASALMPAASRAQDTLGLTGQVFELSDQRFVLQPTEPSAPTIELIVPPLVGESLTRLPQVTLREAEINDLGTVITVDPSANVSPTQLSSLARFNELVDAGGSAPDDALATAFRNLEVTAARSLDPGTPSPGNPRPVTLREGPDVLGLPFADNPLRLRLLEAASAVSLRTVATLENAPDAAAVDELQELMALLSAEIANLEPPAAEDRTRGTAMEKAFYAGGREYAPYVYRLIAANTQGTVGIGETFGAGGGGTLVHCSGALIGPGLVLTARHCLYSDRQGQEVRRRIGSLRVVFDYEIDPGIRMERTDVPVLGLVAEGGPSAVEPGEPLDYALLQIEEAPSSIAYWIYAAAGATAPPSVPTRQVCLSTVNLNRDEEIYVIGHPRTSARAVADNGRVLFPYRVAEETFGYLTHLVLKEIAAAAAAQGADADHLAEQRRRWKESYRAQGDGTYLHNSLQFRGQPTLGIAANTFGGNSGGPVFSKLYNHVVGVFRSGQFDGQTVLPGNWEFHESALPIETVMRDMDRRQTGWMEDLGVCVWGRGDDAFALWSVDADLKAHCDRVCR